MGADRACYRRIRPMNAPSLTTLLAGLLLGGASLAQTASPVAPAPAASTPERSHVLNTEAVPSHFLLDAAGRASNVDWEKPVLGEVAQDVDARRVHRDRQHRLLRVALGAEVGLAHDDRDLAARIART